MNRKDAKVAKTSQINAEAQRRRDIAAKYHEDTVILSNPWPFEPTKRAMTRDRSALVAPTSRRREGVRCRRDARTTKDRSPL